MSFVAERLRELSALGEGHAEPQVPSPREELGPVIAGLQLAIRAGDRSGQEWDVLLALMSHSCRSFLASGGTADELAVELGITMAAVRDLLEKRWPTTSKHTPDPRG